MPLIPLTRGLQVQVDEEDFIRFGCFKWYAQKCGKTFYAARRKGPQEGRALVLLHREILDAPKGIQVDHKDCNSLNCLRSNLRLATHKQNRGNQKKYWKHRSTSQFKGVCFTPQLNQTNPWMAYIGGRPRVHLGYFPTEKLAAKAYDQAAKARYKEFSNLNF